ncbi:MAG: hypothetical protein GFH27_549293n345 [Chloroflexi bacterium AL-W]|nr:hypothetical protein [Chloroflexi bacterium AL-N1]NOK67540.1 hypothetical protein [Chloroflexi bacterium AL-N10]NOK75690.1 hypothetical protein [Chloroflexi bacterium AL-N5]NOK82478.1 hypothetical protein [Chloroflexi bacterium AL-W]NOK90323.1 hypothetical protein [Chloroflexi bacterium AL-N15]
MNSPEIWAALISAVLAFPIGILVSLIAQSTIDRRQKLQLMYERKSEQTFVLAKEELQDKISIIYQGREIKNLYFFNLRIVNSGRKTIRNQAFTCLFSENTQSIDPSFPRVTTIPPREIDIVPSPHNINPNELRYTIIALGPGQSINIDFLTVNNKTSEFQVIFRNNDQEEVSFVEGNITSSPDLDWHLLRSILSLLLIVIIFQVASIVPVAGSLVSIILILPLLLIFIRSVRPVLSAITRKLNSQSDGVIINGGWALIAKELGGGSVHIENLANKDIIKLDVKAENKDNLTYPLLSNTDSPTELAKEIAEVIEIVKEREDTTTEADSVNGEDKR